VTIVPRAAALMASMAGLDEAAYSKMRRDD